MQRIDWKYRIAFVLFWFIMLLMLSNLTSCTSAKKFMQSPDFAKACADSFPAVDTIIETVTHYETDTLLLPADTLILVDTVSVPGGYRVDTIRKPCKSSQIVTRYVTKEKQIIRIDSAQVRNSRIANIQLSADRDKWKGKAQRRGKLAMWSLIGNVLLLLLLGWLIGTKNKLSLFKRE